MGGLSQKLRRRCRKFIAAFFIVIFVLSGLGDALIKRTIPITEAAEVTIDSDVSTTVTEHLQSGTNSVFINDQTGYKFFVDALGYCVYRKTTNGGSTWGATTTVDAQTDCTQISVWYDKWTPGSASSSIHIATLDTGNDDIWYNQLDTVSDTLLLGSSPVSMYTGSAQGGTSLTAGENFVSLTRATDGTIYAVSNDGTGTNDSAVMECTINCNLAASWTERTVLPLDVQSDQNVLMPLAGGDIMIIQRDISANLLRSRVWDESAGSWLAWTTIDPVGGGDNTTYDVGFSATVSSSTPGKVYLAYASDYDALGGDEDVRVGLYNGTSWATSTLTSVISNNAARGITGVAIAIDTSSEDVYVAYSARTTPGTANTGNIYWKTATSSMKNWSTERGPVNVGADDIYGINLNIASDERIFVSWYEAAADDIYGDTIADIYPGIHATTTGTQTVSTYASTTAVYMGGAFVLTQNYQTEDVTGITITESGTIDGFTDIANVKLYYEMDTSAPYTCASESYGGSESQFGSNDANGFSGADGVSTFTGSSVSVSTTSAMCVYVVLDVLDTTMSSSTIDISIADPSTDITTSSLPPGPTTPQNITGTTLVYNDGGTLTHYHWRNDNGTEALATSKTSGVADTALTSLQQSTPVRLRVQVSNEGSSSTPATQYRLEYASNPGTCDAATGWTNVSDSGGDFDMYDTANLLDGGNTTNISVALGGMTDENTTFLTPNLAVKDTSSQTANIILTPAQFVEIEYSIVASTTAAEGNTYCFRVTNQGNPLFAYSQLPRANIAADVSVTASSSQTVSTTTPATNFYIGGKYVITENTASRNVTGITITENGTVDGQTGLDNIKLYYDLDATAPYDCSSETYVGGEAQFGSTDTNGFSGPNGTSTFTGSVAISTTSTMCLYTVLDTTAVALNGETIDIIFEDPSVNLVVSGGASISPTITRDITGSTTLVGAVLTQIRYHWRADNGTEVTATSLSSGAEDTPISNVALTTPVRLRIEVSNEGTVTSPSKAFRIEYGTKVSTCSAVGSWTPVADSGGAWDMYNSANITEGTDTTNIAVASGGVTNENTTFLTPNSAVKDTSGTIASTTLTSTQYLESEFSILQTANAGYETTYCFRLATADSELSTYTRYPELTTAPKRDFEIQRKTSNFSATSLTLTAGVDYVAPSASTSAFVRITNTHYTGAGDSSAGGTQNADDISAYILNPSNIMTSFTIQRPATALATTTRVSWEIVEFIGAVGSDNEMIVRAQGSIPYTTTSLTATTSAVTGIVDDADVVVFITGVGNPDTTTADFNTMQSTSNWLSSSDQATFARGEASGDAVVLSYAVVEFKGINWAVQRSEHNYTAAGTTETEAITAVNSLSRTMLHAQKRVGTNRPGTDEFGHEVWLSSIGYVSYYLETGATAPLLQTSVAWIIENTQTAAGAMEVTYSNGSTVNGSEPLTLSVSIGKTLTDLTNASIFVNSRSAGTGTLYPHPIAGATIASTTHYELWRSDTGGSLAYRTIIVEWPTAGLALKQNFFQFYTDTNALVLNLTDAWPASVGTLGENSVLTADDNPLGEGDRIRIRMSVKAVNATFPAETRAFKLQYGALTTTCSAISEANWSTLGNAASSTIWRGYNATGTVDETQLSSEPPTGGELVLSVSDVAGTLEEENNSAINLNAVPADEDIEYDWIVEQNGAAPETEYCFRMIDTTDTPLDGYLQYPQLITASFTAKSQNWRWYDDEINETPVTALAAENVAPIDIANGQIIKLRVTAKEIKNMGRDDMRFKLQYSQQSNFSTVDDVVATSTCTATSTWCYANGGGVDNAVITTTVLSDPDACVAGVGNGCGTHNESPDALTGFRHKGSAAVEYEFTIQSAGPRVNRVYYFRLYNIANDAVVTTNTGESYPSLVTEGAKLTFGISGLNAATAIEGVTLDVTTTPTSIAFGSVPQNTFVEGGHRLSVDANGTEGYQVLMTMNGDLLSSSGVHIKPLTATNASPSAWGTGCNVSATSCFGYHSGDDTLQGGSTRFSAVDTYARMSTSTAEEVSFSSQPVVTETTDIVFRIFVRQMQEAGLYESNIRYISIPIF